MGLTELPCTEQPEKFTPDTVTFDPAAADAGDTVRDGTLHDVDGFTDGAVDAEVVVGDAAVVAADATAGLSNNPTVTAAAPINPARHETEPLTTPSIWTFEWSRDWGSPRLTDTCSCGGGCRLHGEVVFETYRAEHS